MCSSLQLVGVLQKSQGTGKDQIDRGFVASDQQQDRLGSCFVPDLSGFLMLKFRAPT